MFKGIQLQLLMGPITPVPVPKVVLDSLTNISITEGDNKGGESENGFQLSFEIDYKSPLHTIFLMSGTASSATLHALFRFIIIVTLKGKSIVIMDGVMTNHELKPTEKGPGYLLTVTGKDLSSVMDVEDFSGFPFPALPPSGRVLLMLAKYAVLGITPLVIPSYFVSVPIPSERNPPQGGTDLKYIRSLADQAGYVFYVEPDVIPGSSIAYWGPQIKVGTPQPTLSANMDLHTNVNSISFNFNKEKYKYPVAYNYDEKTGLSTSYPVPPFTPLSPPLGMLPPVITGTEPVGDNLAKFPVPKAIMIGMAKAAQQAESVGAEGSLDVLRYGHILKSRRLVGVRGVGLAYNGLYYVKSVTHSIKRGEYTQSFTLSRNGLISTIQNAAV